MEHDSAAEQDVPATGLAPKTRPTEHGSRSHLHSPLVIGGIAIGLIAWMIVIVLLLIAWRLTSGG